MNCCVRDVYVFNEAELEARMSHNWNPSDYSIDVMYNGSIVAPAMNGLCFMID
jgi:hypothetical protein